MRPHPPPICQSANLSVFVACRSRRTFLLSSYPAILLFFFPLFSMADVWARRVWAYHLHSISTVHPHSHLHLQYVYVLRCLQAHATSSRYRGGQTTGAVYYKFFVTRPKNSILQNRHVLVRSWWVRIKCVLFSSGVVYGGSIWHIFVNGKDDP